MEDAAKRLSDAYLNTLKRGVISDVTAPVYALVLGAAARSGNNQMNDALLDALTTATLAKSSLLGIKENWDQALLHILFYLTQLAVPGANALPLMPATEAMMTRVAAVRNAVLNWIPGAADQLMQHDRAAHAESFLTRAMDELAKLPKNQVSAKQLETIQAARTKAAKKKDDEARRNRSGTIDGGFAAGVGAGAGAGGGAATERDRTLQEFLFAAGIASAPGTDATIEVFTKAEIEVDFLRKHAGTVRPQDLRDRLAIARQRRQPVAPIVADARRQATLLMQAHKFEQAQEFLVLAGQAVLGIETLFVVDNNILLTWLPFRPEDDPWLPSLLYMLAACMEMPLKTRAETEATLIASLEPPIYLVARSMLKSCRDKSVKVPIEQANRGLLNEAEPVDPVSTGINAVVKLILTDALERLGPPPRQSHFALVGLGAVAGCTQSPWAPVDVAIVYECYDDTGQARPAASEMYQQELSAYFQGLSTLMTMKMIFIGEQQTSTEGRQQKSGFGFITGSEGLLVGTPASIASMMQGQFSVDIALIARLWDGCLIGGTRSAQDVFNRFQRRVLDVLMQDHPHLNGTVRQVVAQRILTEAAQADKLKPRLLTVEATSVMDGVLDLPCRIITALSLFYDLKPSRTGAPWALTSRLAALCSDGHIASSIGDALARLLRFGLRLLASAQMHFRSARNDICIGSATLATEVYKLNDAEEHLSVDLYHLAAAPAFSSVLVFLDKLQEKRVGFSREDDEVVIVEEQEAAAALSGPAAVAGAVAGAAGAVADAVVDVAGSVVNMPGKLIDFTLASLGISEPNVDSLIQHHEHAVPFGDMSRFWGGAVARQLHRVGVVENFSTSAKTLRINIAALQRINLSKRAANSVATDDGLTDVMSDVSAWLDLHLGGAKKDSRKEREREKERIRTGGAYGIHPGRVVFEMPNLPMGVTLTDEDYQMIAKDAAARAHAWHDAVVAEIRELVAAGRADESIREHYTAIIGALDTIARGYDDWVGKWIANGRPNSNAVLRHPLFVESLFGEQYEIDPWLAANVFGPDGQFARTVPNARSPVNNQVSNLYLKLDPMLPGHEYAAALLGRLLTRNPSAPATDVLLATHRGHAHLMQAALAVPGGVSLDRVLTEESSKLNKWDAAQFSEMIIVAMATNPADGGPEHYVVQEVDAASGRVHVLAINNSKTFATDSLVAGKVFKKEMPFVRTILFCFNRMRDPVDSTVRQHLIDLDVGQVLSLWLEAMVRYNEACESAYGKEALEAYYNHGKEKESIRLPFFIASERVIDIANKLFRVQEALREPRERPLTHVDLLAIVYDQKFADMVSAELAEVKPPTERYKRFLKENPKKADLLPPATPSQVAQACIMTAPPKSIAAHAALTPQAALKSLRKTLIEKSRERIQEAVVEFTRGNGKPFHKVSDVLLQEEILNAKPFVRMEVALHEDMLRTLFGMNLTHISLVKCLALNNDLLKEFLRAHPSPGAVISLDLSGTNVADGGIVSDFLENLESLTFKRAYALRGFTVKSNERFFERLQLLDLTDNGSVRSLPGLHVLLMRSSLTVRLDS